MQTNGAAMVLASLIGDSLALGAHWIYDTKQIDENIGRVDQLLAPLPGSYHAGKKKGEFTHYGDQALVLLESIVRNNGFSLQGFADDWQGMFRSYTGYLDKASQQTLENFAAGAGPETSGSGSADLGGAARIAPLVLQYRNDPDKLLSTAEEQTAMTHTAPSAIAAAKFLAKSAHLVLHGATPVEAINETAEQGIADMDLEMRLFGALESKGENSREAIRHLGQMCGAANALPGAVHLIISYENDLQTALIENTMAGGDSAARGLAVGMILGAHLGLDAIPMQWLDDLKQHDHIVELLNHLE